MASTIMGSTETTFYTIAIYTSCIKVKKTRFILIAALIATIICLIPLVLMLIPVKSEGFLGLLLDKSVSQIYNASPILTHGVNLQPMISPLPFFNKVPKVFNEEYVNLKASTPKLEDECNIEVYIDYGVIETYINKGQYVISHIVNPLENKLQIDNLSDFKIYTI